MRLLILALVALLLLPISGASACIPDQSYTDSMQLVTVKIGNTYFQIPERYLAYHFERVPFERDYISVQGMQFHDPVVRFYGALQRKNQSDDPHNKKVALNESVEVFSHVKMKDPHALIEVLRSISSAAPPKDWENDLRLAKTLGVGPDPCKGNGNINLSKKEELPPKPVPTYQDILDGLNHKNQEIKVAAAKAVLDKRLLRDRSIEGDKILERLKALSMYGESRRIQEAASNALREIGKSIGEDILNKESESAPDLDCGGNQIAINYCVSVKANNAEREMNELYDLMMKKLSERAQVRLHEAQKAWLVFLEKSCDYEAVGWEGGTGFSMRYDSCRKNMIYKRIAELKEYLACRYNGCPE